MSAEPIENSSAHSVTDDYDVIHLRGEALAVVPLHDVRILQAVSRRAPADMIEDAEMEVVVQEFEEWKAAGRPGVKSHEEFMTELFGHDKKLLAQALGEEP